MKICILSNDPGSHKNEVQSEVFVLWSQHDTCLLKEFSNQLSNKDKNAMKEDADQLQYIHKEKDTGQESLNVKDFD